QIFRMSREEHLSNREIAERCAVSEKAIERQITLALKFIKENLPLFVVFMG
ncbi:RNA polymerase sigma-70 factor, partial [Bacteroides thetaiotaomicron]